MSWRQLSSQGFCPLELLYQFVGQVWYRSVRFESPPLGPEPLLVNQVPATSNRKFPHRSIHRQERASRRLSSSVMSRRVTSVVIDRRFRRDYCFHLQSTDRSDVPEDTHVHCRAVVTWNLRRSVGQETSPDILAPEISYIPLMIRRPISLPTIKSVVRKMSKFFQRNKRDCLFRNIFLSCTCSSSLVLEFHSTDRRSSVVTRGENRWQARREETNKYFGFPTTYGSPSSRWKRTHALVMLLEGASAGHITMAPKITQVPRTRLISSWFHSAHSHVRSWFALSTLNQRLQKGRCLVIYLWPFHSE